MLLYTVFFVSPVRAYVLQIAILSNHQNGRDTHVRQVKLFSPEYVSVVMVMPNHCFCFYLIGCSRHQSPKTANQISQQLNSDQ